MEHLSHLLWIYPTMLVGVWAAVPVGAVWMIVFSPWSSRRRT